MTTDMERLSVYFGGEVYWIGIGVGTGVVVGVLKAFVLKFDGYKGFIEIIQEFWVSFVEIYNVCILHSFIPVCIYQCDADPFFYMLI